jgi:hypothetical protein
MVDFPTGIPDVPDATVAETLFSMHGGLGHVAGTNRMLTNIENLATKLGLGGTAPGATPGVLRRTASGQSAWGQIVGGPGATSDIAVGTIIGGAGGNIAGQTIDNANMANNSVTALNIQAHAVTQGYGATVLGQSTANPAYVNVTGGSLSIPVSAINDEILVWAIGSVYTSLNAGNAIYFAFNLDGGSEFFDMPIIVATNNAQQMLVAGGRFSIPSAVAHTLNWRWRTSNASMTAQMLNGVIYAIQLKR